MVLFQVRKGTPARVLKANGEIVEISTKKDETFENYEIVIDPVGKLTRPDLKETFSPNIFYGFTRNGFVLVVPQHLVQVR